MASLDDRHPAEMVEQALRDAGSATTSELMDATGLGRDTVRKYTTALCAKGRAACRKCVRVGVDGRKQRPTMWVYAGE